MKIFSSCLAGLIFLATGSTAWAEDFNIVGLKLGMTYGEAKQVLLDYGVNPESLQEEQQYFTYTDGLEAHKTDPFLYRLNGSKSVSGEKGRDEDSLGVYFSAPPEASKVVGVWRVISNRNDPPTKGQYMQALTEKYGEPQTYGGTMAWLFPEGKLSCYAGPSLILPDLDIDLIMPKIFLSSGKRYFLDRFQNTKVKSVDDCASYLMYNLGTLSQPDTPARSVNVFMVDVPYWVNTHLKSMEWVAKLQDDATAARLAKSNQPIL